ncbi:MAG: FGGY-family carbohydrate kinase [Cyanobacteria bacterium]|nr:FGGY-family carbohydrate kinase [Cyanobacteriota bacterium]
MVKIISYDLGTSGVKASIFDENGNSIANSFEQYDTYYNGALIHEQKPKDWWNGIIISTKNLLLKSKISPNEIEGVSISGHSLGVVPVDKNGELLCERVPIWSDARARKQAEQFFLIYPYDKWYLMTGNGFPAELYSIFKIIWFKENEPELYKKTYKFLGTKDYINYLLTGNMLTDNSYASGSGVYNLIAGKYDSDLIVASSIDKEKLLEIVPSTYVVGKITKEAANITGLIQGKKVFCGGVDNSCMALGAKCFQEGRIYTSLGSSAWIAVSSSKPILDVKTRPFVFANVVPGQFASAVSIFAAGSSFKWVRDNICKDIVKEAQIKNANPYALMEELAKQSPIGSNGLFFNPSLAGGSSFELTPNIKGGFLGLILAHTTGDMIRAALEGIAMNLGLVLKLLRKLCPISNDMIFVGGGSKSIFWRQMFADIFKCNIIKTNIDQDAASLGAAGIAAVGLGIWKDFSFIDNAHSVQDIRRPISQNVEQYEKYMILFEKISHHCAEIGDLLA